MRIEIELNVNQRYALMSILPMKDSFDNLIIIKDLKE